MDPLEFLVVGEEGCHFNEVVKVFLKEVHSVAVASNWKDFARELRINPAEIEKWRTDMLVDKLTLTDVLHKILESWKEKEGKEATLPNLLNHLETVDLKNVADELRKFFSTGNRVHKSRQLFKQTLPNKPRYYIPRTLITRRVIDLKVFSSSGKDIFVVDGIDRYGLSKLAKRELTDTSIHQVRKPELSVRFILLDRFGDWALLCGKATNAIHLLRLHDEKFHWISTKGGISALQIARDEKNQNELSEESFIHEIEADVQFQTNQPICISDSPGMGKSLLLASIGRQLQQLHPQRCIAFIVISEFVVKIRELLPTFDSTETAVLEALSQILCETIPAREQLVQKIKTATENPSTQVELMFDGFDEVSTENLHLANKCLDTLTTRFNNSIRVWVTTRPQHLHELEKRFSVLGYNIEAFREKHQIKFLTLFWSTEGMKLDEDALEKYTKKCLNTLKNKLNKKDEDIAGIPLQCMMIAEVYKEDAHLFCDSNNERLKKHPAAAPSIHINSIADLYEKMILHKIKKYIETYPLVPAQINSILPCHMYLALELIFPSHAHEFKDTLEIESGLDMIYLLNIGILERRGITTEDPAQFIHRTFAEYLSARFFVYNVIAPGTANWTNASKSLPSFLFEHVLECSVKQDYWSLAYYTCSLRNSVLCHFLDALLNSHETKNCISPKSTDSMKDVIYACVHSDFGNIVKFLRALKYPDSFAMNYLDSRILIDASRVASLDLLKFLLQHFEHEPFTAVLKHRDRPQSALHAAVLRGNYSIFEYILKEDDFEALVKEDERFQNLVYWNVRNTAGGDLDEIQDRVHIVTALCDLNREMINYKYYKNYKKDTPLLTDKVSIVLLKKLMDCGADLLHVDDYESTILHKATEYLSPTDYFDLLQFIPIQTLISLLPMIKDGGEVCFHLIVKRGLATPEILNLILSNGIDINTSGVGGHTCFFYAVSMRNEEMILPTVKMLLENGADHTCVDSVGDSIVHYSAFKGRIDCLRFFLEEKNMNVNQINKREETPLFKAFSYFYKPVFATVQFLLDHGAEYTIIDLYGKNLLHHSAENGDVECVELFLSLGGLDINQVNHDGNTPLMCALKCNQLNMVEMIRLLLGKGADPRISDKEGNNVLHLSVEYGYVECLELFLSLGGLDINQVDNDGDTPLMCALKQSSRNTVEMTTLLIGKGANPRIFDKDGNNVLHLSAKNENAECLELFLSLGGLDINQVNHDGNTPLMCALKCNRLNTVEMITLLIGKGADHTISDIEGNNVLHLSAYNGNEFFSQIVRYPWLDVNARNCKNDTPLHILCRDIEYYPDDYDSLVINIEHFLSLVADVNVKNDDGETPLDIYKSKIACEYKEYGDSDFEYRKNLMQQDSTIRRLLEDKGQGEGHDKGADHTISNKKGTNVLHISAEIGDAECFSYFVRLPSLDVNARNCENDTPLYVLCRNIIKHFKDYDSLLSNIEHLLSLGADANAKNDEGETPLDIFEFKRGELERFKPEAVDCEDSEAEDFEVKYLAIHRLLGGKGQEDIHEQESMLPASPGLAVSALDLRISSVKARND